MEGKTIKRMANIIGVIGLCSGFVVMFATFMLLYFGKCDGSIDINYYGEANFEFVLLMVLLPFVVYTIWWHMKTICRSIF